MTKAQKDRTVYLALPYNFSLSGWVVQVVLPNEVHVLVCWLVFHGILHNRYIVTDMFVMWRVGMDE